MKKTIFSKIAPLLLFASSFASAAVINGTTIAGAQLTITGSGFTGTPLAVTLDGTKLSVVSSTSTQIIATLNPIPSPGTYRLVVKAGIASTFSYVAISAAPNIVAQVSLTGQTGSIPATTLLTPQANGLYRVSWVVVVTTASSTGSVISGQLTLADDSGPAGCYPFVTPTSGTSTGSYGGMCVARANSGTPLSYFLAVSGTPTYELFITVEQLK